MSNDRVPGAESARKMLSVLLCFSPDRPRWSVPDLCKELSVSPSTMYRYVALLREVGFLDTAGDNLYRVSGRVLTLAAAAEQGRSSLESVSLPIMRRIRDISGETVLIARRNKTYVYCVDRVESEKPVRLQFDRGQPMSLHKGSLARVLLSHMAPEEREAYLELVRPGLNDKSQALLTPESLDAVKKDGYTQSFEELDEGIWGTAAVIKHFGQAFAAIGVAAPLYRLDARMRELTIAAVREGAAEISELLSSGA